MRAATLPLGLALLCAGFVSAQPKIHPDELRLKPKIDAAIASGVEALLSTQLRDGTWGRYGRYDGGKTALCAYALVKSGVGVDHPAVRRALLYLDGVRPKETYTVACMMLAYAATGTPEHLRRVKDLAKLLVEWQLERGDYGYPFSGSGGAKFTRPDLSNTQYAALGLWVAQMHKVKIPTKVWRGLIDAALQYQSKPEQVVPKRSNAKDARRTIAGGKVEIKGFGYVRGRRPTGSMTTAGVSILQICKIGLGSRLRKGRSRVEDAVEKGVAWLGHHFSVRSNPGARASWLYYYLYGMERVGSLTRLEQFGDHWWYVRGARQLIRAQNADGTWHTGANLEVETSFALLFLKRATSGAAATGRSSKGVTKRHLFSGGDEFDAVLIGGAGQQPLSLWIKGFGTELKKRHARHGIRVLQVEYMLGKRVLGQLIGDPTKAWKTDAFLHRVDALHRGNHDIRARVKLIAPDVAAGGTEPTEYVESRLMRVEIRDVFRKWMEAAAKLSTPSNLLRTIGLSVRATSNQGAAKNAADGNDSSHWVCNPDDEQPEITIQLTKPISASKLLITQAGARGRDRGLYDHILDVDVFINKDVKPILIELDEDQMAVTSFDLPTRRKIRSLRLRIVARAPGRRALQAGFSEIALLK